MTDDRGQPQLFPLINNYKYLFVIGDVMPHVESSDTQAGFNFAASLPESIEIARDRPVAARSGIVNCKITYDVNEGEPSDSEGSALSDTDGGLGDSKCYDSYLEGTMSIFIGTLDTSSSAMNTSRDDDDGSVV